MCFSVAGVDEYLSLISDTAGPLGLALRALSPTDRGAVKADIEGALARFAVEGRYDIPGVARCAVAA